MLRHLRTSCLCLHRWFGLAGASFLVVIGLTGSMLAYYEELDAWMAPQLLATAQPEQPPLDLAVLAQRAQELVPEVQVVEATWRHAGRQAEIRTRPLADTSAGADPGFDSILLDPWTGAELGRRTWGDIRQGTINFAPFVYRLHYELALGQPGLLLLGFVAAGWTLDCFVGLLLTLPMPARRVGGRHPVKSFRSRWAPAWKIKHPASGTRRIFDLHRAFSLWCWIVLLVFAWSSVSFNLPSLYEPVMRVLTGYEAPAVADSLRIGPETDTPTVLSWPQALNNARHQMETQTQLHGLIIDDEVMLRFMPNQGLWLYRTRTDRDVLERRGASDLYLDAHTGDLVALQLPTKQQAGQTVTHWLFALHVADVWGWPWQLAVAVLGIVLTMLSITGVLIWICKRAARSR